MSKLLLLMLIGASSLHADVLLFSGSTRKESYNKKLILEAAKVVEELGRKAQVLELKDYPMPFYDGDLEQFSGMPERAKAFRKAMINAQVIIIASPEYNSSISGVLKNTIDWASRSETGGSSRDAFKGKTFVLLSASPGSSGGRRGLVHLRAIIQAIGGTVLTSELSVAHAKDAFEPTFKHRQALQDLIAQVVTSMPN